MSTSTCRHLVIKTSIVLITSLVSCQSKSSDPKTDAVMKLAIHYLNTNKPDSLYQLTGEGFKKHMTPTLSASTYKEKIVALLPLANVTFITNSDSVSIYKVDGKIPLNCYISLDKQNKIKKFYFLPYQKELKAVSMSTDENRTDILAHKVLNLINRKQADSAYLLAGDQFKSKVNAARWREFADYTAMLTSLAPPVFLRREKGNNIYIIRSYQFIFGSLDNNGKFNVLGFYPYTESEVKAKKVSTDNKLITQLDSVVDKVLSAYIQTKGNVGVSVGVFYNGKNSFYNYGERKMGSNQLPDQHTLYDIGSITKTFTSTLLALAINKGKVTLETPIIKFLPDSVAANRDLKKIKFKDLANHTSGLPREGENFEQTIIDANQPFANYGTNEMFSFLKHFKPTRQPGVKYEYSNFAVGLLGLLLENIYRESYPDLVRKYITVPLQMNETVCAVDSLKFKDLAEGYGELSQSVPFIKMTSLQSAGIIKSSASDLINFTKAQLFTSDPTLSAAIKLAHLVTYDNGEIVVGLIWHYLPNNENILHHGGAAIGYRSFICMDLNQKIAVVILTNNASASDEMGINLIKAIQAIKN